MLNSLWKKKTLSLRSDEQEYANISSNENNPSSKGEKYVEDYEV